MDCSANSHSSTGTSTSTNTSASTSAGAVAERTDGALATAEDVPLEWLPPGAKASPIASEEIFPPQTITIRFEHARHLALEHKPPIACPFCHGKALTSDKAADRLLPDPVATCDGCHGSRHDNLDRVEPGPQPDGQCPSCHLGADAGRDGRVARFVLPTPNLRNSHRKHAARNIGCPQCHGSVAAVGLATRDQLPRMSGCFVCHAMSGPARGEARGHCTNCHIVAPGGRLQTTFSTGKLVPPAWLHGAGHGPGWVTGHRQQAAANSAMCANCHAEQFCIDCHDGKVRPREIHPGDWISMHPVAARQDSPRCVSCHQLQSFCGDCHRRVGVARDAPSDARVAGRRFHPPPAVWSAAPRGAAHHAWEAQRNLNACIACHSERDCATCHATKGLRGGAGIHPHPPNFDPGGAYQRNPRPCLVCHSPSDPVLHR